MTTPIATNTLFILIGLILLGLGIFAYFRQRARIERSQQAVGVVVELIPRRARNTYLYSKTKDGVKIERKYLYRPVIQFKPQKGRLVRFVASVSSHPAPYQIGDKVEVIYDPENPRQAQINKFLYLWFYVIMLICFGLLTVGMGILVYLMS